MNDMFASSPYSPDRVFEQVAERMKTLQNTNADLTKEVTELRSMHNQVVQKMKADQKRSYDDLLERIDVLQAERFVQDNTIDNLKYNNTILHNELQLYANFMDNLPSQEAEEGYGDQAWDGSYTSAAAISNANDLFQCRGQF